MNPIVLIGAGGHAASCIDVIETGGNFRVAGIVGMDGELNRRVCGYEVIGTDQDLAKLAAEYRYALITVGQIKSAEDRIRLYRQAREAGFVFPYIGSAHAYISKHAHVGAGSIVMHGAVVNANARVGENCIINSRALIEHDTEVGDHCHISTGAILNGNGIIGDCCFIGSGALTMHGISIGANCLVGIASVVRHDLPDKTSYWAGNLHA